jgi:hypothetical protein
MKRILLIAGLLLSLILSCNALDITLYSENLTTNVHNDTVDFLPCFEAIKSGVNITQDNVWYVWTYEKNGAIEQIDFNTVNTSDFVYVLTLYPEFTLAPGDNIYVELLAANGSNNSQIFFNEQVNKTYCFGGTTTTSSSTSTTGGVTTTTMIGTTTSTGGVTTSVAPSSAPGTTVYGYSFPHGDHGTLPGLNGTGGITINNGTLKNMPCTGFCIIGLNKQEFELYAALMITTLVMLSIKPFKLGASASAISLLFFTNIMGWTTITTSATLIFLLIALGSWIWEARG